MASQPSLARPFTVTRQKLELVAPVKPTPCEIKYLSDIDDQQGLRFQLPVINFYCNEPSMSGKDPVQVIRQALTKTLVFFYLFAGRLREGAGRKLMVDCTGEGVMFIEADADATLQHFDIGGEVKPPFPCFDQLLYNVPGSAYILNSPLIFIQVTRLRCGGFILALRLNHTMADAFGIVHLVNTIAEIARGAETPSFQPVWQREFFKARNPPRITCTHYEYEEEPVDSMGTNIPLDNLVHRSFFFGPTDISALCRSLPPHLRKCSTVEILTACMWAMWRCRTIALGFDRDEDVRMLLLVSARPKFKVLDVDFGWGKAVFGGPAHGGAGDAPGVITFHSTYHLKITKEMAF